MSRNEEFERGHGFKFSVDHDTVIPGHSLVLAHDSAGQEVGYMELGPDGEQGRRVMDLQVSPEHRRKGVATGMWSHAKGSGLNPTHSSMRTKAGDQWARSVGDYYPPSEIT